jgi:hypothetical protein
VFQNRVLRRIFVPTGDEMAGGWRRLHNEELHNFYASPDVNGVIKSRRTRCAVYAAHIREVRLRSTWEDNFRMDLCEIGWRRVDWT